uniref:Uncharacterized protein n=1 Tax=Sphaerodactylus townsendi TaxID=933632 RepID=A0ACB8ESF4_9SAUR
MATGQVLLAEQAGEEEQLAQTLGDSGNDSSSSGQGSIETSPEGRVLLERRSWRRVAVLANVSRQLLQDREEAVRRHANVMGSIQAALDRGAAALEAVNSLLAQRMMGQPPMQQPSPQAVPPPPSCSLQGIRPGPALTADIHQFLNLEPSENYAACLNHMPEMKPAMSQRASTSNSPVATHISEPDLDGVNSTPSLPVSLESKGAPVRLTGKRRLGHTSLRESQKNGENTNETKWAKWARKLKHVLDMWVPLNNMPGSC